MFMQPQIYETDYIEIDGPYGTEIVPCDVDNFDIPEITQWPKQGDCEDNREIPSPLAMYCENEWAYTIERKHGFVARMSASGYMDATEWSAHETEEEARKYLGNHQGLAAIDQAADAAEERKRLWCEVEGCDAHARFCACGSAHCQDHPHE